MYMDMSNTRTCSFTDCLRPYLAKDLCNFHYYRNKLGKPMDVTPRKYYPPEDNLIRNKRGVIMLESPCESCGISRQVIRYVAEEYPLCVSCSAKERDRKYIEEHGRGRMWRGSENFSGKIIRSWERGAEKRDIVWELDGNILDRLYEQQNGLCALTGNELSFNDGDINKISLDRIDPVVGYVIGNVQFVCAYVNICKQSLTNQQFINMCSQVANHASDVTVWYE